MIVLLSSLVQGVTLAQQLSVETYYERTLISPKTGTALGYTFRGKLCAGVFYQEHSQMFYGEREMTSQIEDEFYGFYMSGPVTEWRRASLILKARTGIANGENFMISPSVHADFAVLKRVHIGTGIAMRSILPSVMTSIRIDLSKPAKRIHYLAKL